MICISDISANVQHSTLRSFADDTRLIKSVNSEDDAADLQNDLNAVFDWASTNKMSFNTEKFEMLSYRKHSRVDIPEFIYLDCSLSPIESKVCVKDLGIEMSNDCSFSYHIDKVCSTMLKLSSWTCRTFGSRSRLLFLTVWKSLVVPHHDYCSQLWSPYKLMDIEKLERVQWNFLRKINKCPSNYWDALQYFKVPSLQRRRERYQIFYCWKMLENMVPPLMSPDGFSTTIQVKPSQRRGRTCHVLQCDKRSTKAVQTLKSKSFSAHSVDLFNVLPKKLRDVQDCKFDAFKKACDKFLSAVPDQPHLKGLSKFRHANTNSLIDMIPFYYGTNY